MNAKQPEPLSERQEDMVKAIKAHLDAVGLPPTRKELAAALSIYPNAADEQLRRLERKGWVRLMRGTARGIFLNDPEAIA